MAAENDLVTVSLILSGTHKNEWKGIPAADEFINVTTMMFFRFKNGQVVDIWEEFDEFGMRKQLSES